MAENFNPHIPHRRQLACLPGDPDTQLHLIHPAHQRNAPLHADRELRLPPTRSPSSPPPRSRAAAAGRELRLPRSTSSSSATSAAHSPASSTGRRYSRAPRCCCPGAVAAGPAPPHRARAAAAMPPLPASLPRTVRRVACRRCSCGWERGGGLRERVLKGERRLEKDGRGRLWWECQRWWWLRLLGPRELGRGFLRVCYFVRGL